MQITRILGVALKRLTVIIFIAAVFIFILINLLALAEPQKLAAPTQQALVISDVNLVDPQGVGAITANQMVIVEGNVITYVGANGSKAAPVDAKVIHATGQYLMAGLIDAHVHSVRLSPQLHFPLLIANGVTGIRDMGDSCSWSEDKNCQPDNELWRGQRMLGEIVAPRILQSVSYHHEDDNIDTAALTERLAIIQQRGEPFLKIQLDAQIPQPDFAKIMEIAQSRGIAVAGHVPFSVDLMQGQYRMASIEHDVSLLAQCSDHRAQFDGRNRHKPLLLQGLSSNRCEALLQQLAKQQVAYVPTHIASTGQDLRYAKGGNTATEAALIQRYVVAPQRWLWQLIASASREEPAEQQILADFHAAALALSKQANDAGVMVLAGTDALDAGVLHGFSLHQELQYLVSAGFSPAEALYSATLAPAKAFGVSQDLSSIAAGKIADLVLLSANPLVDITNTTKITAVIADGRLYQQNERDQALNYVEQQAHTLAVNSRFLRGLWFVSTPSDSK